MPLIFVCTGIKRCFMLTEFALQTLLRDSNPGPTAYRVAVLGVKPWEYEKISNTAERSLQTLRTVALSESVACSLSS